MQQLPTAIYSASAVDNEMEFCFLLIQDSEDLMYFFFLFFSFCFRYIISCILVLWPFLHTLYLYLVYIY